MCCWVFVAKYLIISIASVNRRPTQHRHLRICTQICSQKHSWSIICSVSPHDPTCVAQLYIVKWMVRRRISLLAVISITRVFVYACKMSVVCMRAYTHPSLSCNVSTWLLNTYKRTDYFKILFWNRFGIRFSATERCDFKLNLCYIP